MNWLWLLAVRIVSLGGCHRRNFGFEAYGVNRAVFTAKVSSRNGDKDDLAEREWASGGGKVFHGY